MGTNSLQKSPLCAIFCPFHPAITIASINGRASGGGAEIGWACDLRIAEEGVKFCQPEVDLNLTSGLTLGKIFATSS